ncbi:type I restriction-modification system, DNA specificity domain [Aliivibrio wodanis]|uniref:Type I restriction-modification system, DNA specificity domain n=1 Tax=Aliivibrio wodanis TaxID=80852 RepID=A0A090ISG8_9GAMM|nr:type I restriction-modification system, DNA specificity domain [Aliivibrio wodanis]
MSEFVPEGWTIGTLNEFASIKGGKRLPKGEQFSSIKTDYPYIRVTDFKNGSIDQRDLRYVSECIRDQIKRYVISSNDLYISIAGTLGLVGEVPKKLDGALLTENAAKIIFNSSQLTDKVFFKYYLNSIEAQEQFNQSKGTGGGVPKLALFRIEDTLVLVPPLPEQQKIAAILTSVDEVIENTQAQINKLKDLKTGMMQELLTRGVGVDGKRHTEFKDSPVGRIPKGWEVVKLDNVATIQTGAAKSSKLTGDLIELPYLRVANVQDGYLNLAEIKKIMIPRNKSERFLLQNNDVLVNEGGDFDKLGRGSIWHSQITPCAHQNHVFVVRTDSKKLSPMFFNHISGSEYGKKYYMGCAKQTTNLASINSTQLKQFPVLLPSLEEQDSICEVLDSVDQTIAKNQVKLAQNRNLKKALMQDLLTGKVRVDTE